MNLTKSVKYAIFVMAKKEEKPMVRELEYPLTLSIKTPAELVEMLKKDVNEFNAWRVANPIASIAMNGVDFSYCYLRGANLRGARLEAANFRETNLLHADLTDAHLYGARNLATAKLFCITADARTRDTITSLVMADFYNMKSTWR